MKAKRLLPVNALRKAVRVMVPACIDEDRTTPEPQPSFKIWLGVLEEGFEASVHCEADYFQVTYIGFSGGRAGLSWVFQSIFLPKL